MSVCDKSVIKNIFANLDDIIGWSNEEMVRATAKYNSRTFSEETEIKAKNEIFEIDSLEQFVEALKTAKKQLAVSLDIKL